MMTDKRRFLVRLCSYYDQGIEPKGGRQWQLTEHTVT
jgi:hypothetical protein